MRWIINGFGNLKGLDMTTSAGPKMKLKHNVHTKEPLFIDVTNNGRPWYLVASTKAGGELREDYYNYEASIENGIPITIICKDNAKVELLPKGRFLRARYDSSTK